MWGLLAFLMILMCSHFMDTANAVGLVVCAGLALLFLSIWSCQGSNTPQGRRDARERYERESKEENDFGVIDWDK